MEDSQRENQMLIEEMLRRAEKAEEPGELAQQRVIHQGDGEVPVPMVASEIRSAGYAFIYDTVTGEQSKTNRNMLPAQLKKKRSDGSYVFTTVRPNIEPKRGTFKCLLHKDAPNRAYYDELGLAVCPKDNLTSPFQVRRHMEKRHRMEWAAIDAERIEKEQARERELREALLKQATQPPMVIAGQPAKRRKK